MTGFDLLPAAARPGTPWKNGGGQTWQLASFPTGAGVEDFRWRISIAQITLSVARADV